MTFIPADLYFNDGGDKHIADTLLYLYDNDPEPGSGYWITDNAYAIDKRPDWGVWWFAYFNNNNTVKIGVSDSFTNIPTEQEILDGVANSENFSWTGNLQSNTTPISNICFPAGTPISCNQGNIPIEKINPDIHTIRNKKIVGITKTITQDKYLVCFEKDALGTNFPLQKTITSKNHRILYKGNMIRAIEFVRLNDKVYKIKYGKEVLYNVLMEEHDKMGVNNLICETLHPENCIAKLYGYLQKINPEEQNDLINKYNEYIIKNKTFTSKN
jgi:hypothetical protein